MKKIFVAGDVTFNGLIYVDQLPKPEPQTVFSTGFHETVGGTAAGKALNLSKLGFDVTLHGLIGDDAPGEQIRAYLDAHNLTFDYDIDPKGTQRHINLMDAVGRRISIYVAYATFDPEIDLDRLETRIAGSDYVVLNLSNYCRRLIPLAQRHGKPIWCDIHDYDGKNDYHRDFIAGADFLQMSSDRMPDYRPFMEALIADGKRLVICTHGKDGSSALMAEGEWIETPALTGYPLRDSNGAGDSFFAGVVYGYATHYPTETCLKMGAINAALCITSSELVFSGLSPARMMAEYRQHYGD